MATVSAIIKILSQTDSRGFDDARKSLEKLGQSLVATGKTNTNTTEKMIKEWNQTQQQIGSATRQIGQAMMNIGQNLTFSITAPLVYSGKQVAEFGANFEQTMVAIAVSAGKTKKEVFDLGEEYLKSGAKSTVGAQEQARAGLRVQQAGLDIHTAQQLSSRGAKFFEANFDDAERTTANYNDSVEKTLQVTRMFGGAEVEKMIRMKDSNAIMKVAIRDQDMLTTLMQKSATRMQPLLEGLTYFGPAAAAGGIELKEALIFHGIAADAGVDGSRAGREFASGFIQMFSPAAKESLDELGIKVKDKFGNIVPAREIIAQLNQAFYGDVDALRKKGVLTKEASADQIKANENVARADTAFRNAQLKAQGELNDAINKKQKTTGSAASQQEVEAATLRVTSAQQRLNELRAKGNKVAKSTVTSAEASLKSAQTSLDKLRAKGPRTTGAAPTPEELNAYKQAQASLVGTQAQVEKQTFALMKNDAVWSKLTDTQRSQILAANRAAQGIQNATDAYNKSKKGGTELLTVNGKLAESERILYENKILGQAGMRAWDSVIRGGTESYDDYNKALEKGITTEEMAVKKTQNLKDKMTILKNNVQSAMTRAFLPLIDKFFIPLIEKLNKAVEWFDGLSQAQKETIIKALAVAAAIGPIIYAMGSVLFVVGMLRQGLAQLATVGLLQATKGFSGLSLVLGPFNLLLVAIGLAIGAVAKALIENTGGIRDQLKPAFDKILGYFNDLKLWLDDKIPKAIDAFGGFMSSLGVSILKNIDFNAIFGKFDELRKSFENLLKTIFGDEDLFAPIKVGPDAMVKGRRGQAGGTFEETAATKTTTKLAEMAKRFGGGIGEILANITNKVIPGFLVALKTVTDALALHIPEWKSIAEENNPYTQRSLENLLGALDKLANATGRFLPTGDASANGVMRLVTEIAKISNAINASVIDTIAEAINHLADAIGRLLNLDILGAIESIGKYNLKVSPLGILGTILPKDATGAGLTKPLEEMISAQVEYVRQRVADILRNYSRNPLAPNDNEIVPPDTSPFEEGIKESHGKILSDADKFREGILKKYNFSEEAAKEIKKAWILLDNPLPHAKGAIGTTTPGIFGSAPLIALTKEGQEDWVAVHEFAHAWFLQTDKNAREQFANAIKRVSTNPNAMAKLPEKTSANMDNIIKDNVDEMYATIAGDIMGDLSKLPNELKPFYQNLFNDTNTKGAKDGATNLGNSLIIGIGAGIATGVEEAVQAMTDAIQQVWTSAENTVALLPPLEMPQSASGYGSSGGGVPADIQGDMRPLNMTFHIGEVKSEDDVYFLAREVAKVIRENGC